MKKICFALMCVILSGMLYAQVPQEGYTNAVIVKFKSHADSGMSARQHQVFSNATLSTLNKTHGVNNIKAIGSKKQGDTYILHFDTKQNMEEVIQAYRNTHLFEYVEPDFIGKGSGRRAIAEDSPNDAYFYRQYGLYNNGSFSLSDASDDADIDMELAWNIEKGSASVTVAILDSGLKLDHPEFDGRIWNNASEVSDGADNDDNGYVNDVQGWDFANEDNDPTDDHGHGTNVTGIIGANGNNGIGYAGVDWNAKLMICKVLDENDFGYYSWWAEAIYYAVDNGADVINMSLVGKDYSNLLQEAVSYAYNKGVVIVACMGNDDNDDISYPAGFATTIAVGATNANDERSSPFFWGATSGSNYGAHIDVVAPGNYIFGLDYLSNTNYNTYWGGTSQATPLVTGVCALMLAHDAHLSPEEVRSIIRKTAEDQVGNPTEDVSGFDIYYGYGRINAYQALLASNHIINSLDEEVYEFSLFPNPASSYLTIKGALSNTTIQVFNLLGVELARQYVQPTMSSIQLDVSKWNSGPYIIVIRDASENLLLTEKILVR